MPQSPLYSRTIVVISFVRAKGDVERRIQIHPGHVAFVVIVRKKASARRLRNFLSEALSVAAAAARNRDTTRVRSSLYSTE